MTPLLVESSNPFTSLEFGVKADHRSVNVYNLMRRQLRVSVCSIGRIVGVGVNSRTQPRHGTSMTHSVLNI